MNEHGFGGSNSAMLANPNGPRGLVVRALAFARRTLAADARPAPSPETTEPPERRLGREDLRNDLNGARLTRQSDSSLWLVHNGMRHRILDEDLHGRLFRDRDRLILDPILHKVARGPDLLADTGLVKAAGAFGIYLRARSLDGRAVLHPIPSQDIFQLFDFDPARVQSVSEALIGQTPVAAPLLGPSPADQPGGHEDEVANALGHLRRMNEDLQLRRYVLESDHQRAVASLDRARQTIRALEADLARRDAELSMLRNQAAKP